MCVLWHYFIFADIIKLIVCSLKSCMLLACMLNMLFVISLCLILHALDNNSHDIYVADSYIKRFFFWVMDLNSWISLLMNKNRSNIVRINAYMIIIISPPYRIFLFLFAFGREPRNFTKKTKYEHHTAPPSCFQQLRTKTYWVAFRQLRTMTRWDDCVYVMYVLSPYRTLLFFIESVRCFALTLNFSL